MVRSTETLKAVAPKKAKNEAAASNDAFDSESVRWLLVHLTT